MGSSKTRRASQGWSQQVTDPNVEAALEQTGAGAVASARPYVGQSNCPSRSREGLRGFSQLYQMLGRAHK